MKKKSNANFIYFSFRFNWFLFSISFVKCSNDKIKWTVLNLAKEKKTSHPNNSFLYKYGTILCSNIAGEKKKHRFFLNIRWKEPRAKGNVMIRC